MALGSGRQAAPPSPRRAWKAAVLTVSALTAFAANSLLCRLALHDASIDPASFTTVRLTAGALTLLLVSAFVGSTGPPRVRGNWASAAMLFLYAITFSLAYVSLSTASGALILFGSVQLTMILFALWSGERPRWTEWSGLLLALGGLVYLVSPGLTAPSPAGSALMIAAGIAWGAYTLRGRGSPRPLADTTGNFARSVPLVLIAGAIAFVGFRLHTTPRGWLLALASGALASGLGYVVWYAALEHLTAMRAATVQLAVPVLAALGGVVVLQESVTVRLVLAAVLILGGIGLAVAGAGRPSATPTPSGRGAGR